MAENFRQLNFSQLEKKIKNLNLKRPQHASTQALIDVLEEHYAAKSVATQPASIAQGKPNTALIETVSGDAAAPKQKLKPMEERIKHVVVGYFLWLGMMTVSFVIIHLLTNRDTSWWDWQDRVHGWAKGYAMWLFTIFTGCWCVHLFFAVYVLGPNLVEACGWLPTGVEEATAISLVAYFLTSAVLITLHAFVTTFTSTLLRTSRVLVTTSTSALDYAASFWLFNAPFLLYHKCELYTTPLWGSSRCAPVLAAELRARSEDDVAEALAASGSDDAKQRFPSIEATTGAEVDPDTASDTSDDVRDNSRVKMDFEQALAASDHADAVQRVPSLGAALGGSPDSGTAADTASQVPGAQHVKTAAEKACEKDGRHSEPMAIGRAKSSSCAACEKLQIENRQLLSGVHQLEQSIYHLSRSKDIDKKQDEPSAGPGAAYWPVPNQFGTGLSMKPDPEQNRERREGPTAGFQERISALKKQVSTLRIEHDKALATSKRDFDQQIVDIVARHKAQVAELELQVEAGHKELETVRDELKIVHGESEQHIARVTSEHQSEIALLHAEHDSALASLNESLLSEHRTSCSEMARTIRRVQYDGMLLFARALSKERVFTLAFVWQNDAHPGQRTLAVHRRLALVKLVEPLGKEKVFPFHWVSQVKGSIAHSSLFTLVGGLCLRILEGCTTLLFADGMSGAGKSTAMFRSQTSIASTAIGLLVAFAKEQLVSVQCNFQEIYNDEVVNLLKDTKLANGQVPITSVTDALAVYAKMVRQALQRARTNSTKANAKSSRGHTLCTISISTTSGVTKLFLLDLAGSEDMPVVQNADCGLQHDTEATTREGAHEAKKIKISRDEFLHTVKQFASGKVQKVLLGSSKLVRIFTEDVWTKPATVIRMTCSPTQCDDYYTNLALKTGQRADAPTLSWTQDDGAAEDELSLVAEGTPMSYQEAQHSQVPPKGKLVCAALPGGR